MYIGYWIILGLIEARAGHDSCGVKANKGAGHLLIRGYKLKASIRCHRESSYATRSIGPDPFEPEDSAAFQCGGTGVVCWGVFFHILRGSGPSLTPVREHQTLASDHRSSGSSGGSQAMISCVNAKAANSYTSS